MNAKKFRSVVGAICIATSVALMMLFTFCTTVTYVGTQIGVFSRTHLEVNTIDYIFIMVICVPILVVCAKTRCFYRGLYDEKD